MLMLALFFMEPPLLTFQDIEREALRLQKPVLVFQDCDPIPGPWVGWITKSKRDPDPLIIVSVIRDGKLVFRAWVTPGVGVEQRIENVLRR